MLLLLWVPLFGWLSAPGAHAAALQQLRRARPARSACNWRCSSIIFSRSSGTMRCSSCASGSLARLPSASSKLWLNSTPPAISRPIWLRPNHISGITSGTAPNRGPSTLV